MSKKLRELKAKKATLVAQANTLAAAAADGIFSEAQQAEFNDLKSQIEGINRQIEAENFLIEQGAGLAAGSGQGNFIEVHDRREDDPTRGFRSFGDFAQAVAGSSIHGARDERLNFASAVAGFQDRQAAAPTTFGNEGSGADGGFAIPPQFSEEIWRLALGEESLIPLTQNTEITGNSMIFPKDESTPWGGSGVQVQWQSEAVAGAQSKPIIGTNTMVLHKMIALVPVTNELIADGFAIGSYLNQTAPDRITWKANEGILFGDGTGKPLGAMMGDSVIVQAKDSGQATQTVSSANLSNMVTRLLVGELKNAIWLAIPDILTPLEGLTVGQYPIYLPGQSAANAPYGLLKGRPLMLSEHASAFSSQGDINLLSLKGYRTITKAGGIQTSTSMHLYFDADATAFKFTFRMNGQPILSAPVTPPKSGKTRSHFITLAAR
ncbi:MAG TPA: phage major capsid protein [Rhodocyclaceae bacterium]|jgi:HK97 family phage major capsid protein